MVTPAVGSVVLVRFPFSDLSESKLRPAVVLADGGRGDWILCQVTSRPYADPKAIELTDACFASGSLRIVSYARPGKLFTANQELMVREEGVLKESVRRQIVATLLRMMRNPRRSAEEWGNPEGAESPPEGQS